MRTCPPAELVKDHGEECLYPESHSRTRKRKDRDKAMDERFARLEAMLQATMGPRQSSEPSVPSGPGPGPEAAPLEADASGQEHAPTSFNTMSQPPTSIYEGTPAVESDTVIVSRGDVLTPSRYSVTTSTIAPCLPIPDDFRRSSPPASEYSAAPTLLMDILPLSFDPPSKRLRDDEGFSSTRDPYPARTIQTHAPISPPSTAVVDESCTSRDGDSPELQRPVSYLSICSEPAVDWVAREVGVTDFISTARKLTADMMRNEKLGQTVQPDRAPEPGIATAWRWVSAFFDEGLDSVYGVVHRPAFEARLKAHFEHAPSAKDDPGWYALRNTIYAAGCRISLSEGASPKSFTKARAQAWRYFENALSVHTDLIYSRSDLTAVQALLSMAFFAEALGSPALEFMLVSNATRLAQSKGMHLQVAESWKMREEEAQVRYWLWWCVYSYDKHLAYRSGRPSVCQSFLVPPTVDVLTPFRQSMTTT